MAHDHDAQILHELREIVTLLREIKRELKERPVPPVSALQITFGTPEPR